MPKGGGSADLALRIAKFTAIVLFGLVFPALLLSGAYRATQTVADYAEEQPGHHEVTVTVPPPVNQFARPSDYALYGMMYVESSGRRVVSIRQAMKISVIQIGLAVISIGIMLIMLGIDAGGVEVKVEGGTQTVPKLAVDIKTASSGVAVFIVGATMSMLGGLIKNEYQAASVPGFLGTSDVKTVGIPKETILQSFDTCKQLSKVKDLDAMRTCLAVYIDTLNNGG
ncbi:MAG: hypothetical protein JO142_15170 [Burkholderiales bacterium]|nr:hypothetical protein [Burkholderiales bacterium]